MAKYNCSFIVGPMSQNSGPHTFQAFGITDPGRKRTLNEDSFGVDEELGLLIVADGMGGHEAGEVASQLAAKEINQFIREQLRASTHSDSAPLLNAEDETITATPDAFDIVLNATHEACKAINEVNHKRGHPDGSGMGCTVSGIWYSSDKQRTIVFNVGDSRVYKVHDGEMTQLTRDHTAYQEWLDNGELGPAPKKNIITRALGPWPKISVDTQVDIPSPGDLYLACSDGLWNMLDDENIIKTINAGNDLADICTALVDQANENGGRDNITVVLGRI